MKKSAEGLESFNYLKEFRTDPPFTIKPYDNVTEVWLLREINDFPKVSCDPPDPERDLYTRVSLPSYNTNRQRTYRYRAEQTKTYRLMKVKLKKERFHVCALTGVLGSGKTSFLNQFIEDEKIDLIYVAEQHSLLKDGSRKLNLTSGATMTLFKLTKLLFGLSNANCSDYRNILHRIPMETLYSMDLPSKFPLQENALDKLFGMANPRSIPNKHLVVSIDDFNLINTNELYMVTGMLRRLINATASGVSVILLLCGDPYKIQPIFVPPQPRDYELPEQQTEEAPGDEARRHQVPRCSNEQRLKSKNVDASIKLAQTLYEFKHPTIDHQQKEYHEFLRSSKSFKNMLLDCHQFFTEKFSVREIPHKYCIEALRQIPTLYDSQMIRNLDENDHAKFAAWVSKWDEQFNDSVCYSYLNVEAHHMNLLIAISTWHQCKAFNMQASGTGNEPLPVQMMPKLIHIQFVDSQDQPRFGCHEKFEEQPYLPLIIGFRYKILETQNRVFRGEIVTLVQVEYSDFPQSCQQVSALVVISAEGDCIRITPGYFEMTLYCEKISQTERFRYFDEHDVKSAGNTEGGNRFLYGFPLQLAFAKTVRGSIGPPIESNVYANLANFSEEEIYTLLAKIRDPRKIQGFAG